MNRLAAHALAALVVAVVAVAAAAAWYYGVGWKAFSFTQTAGAAAPSWTPSGGGADPPAADRLRFRKAVFTVTTAAGATHAADVTAVLNGMAVAHRGSPTAPADLVLASPLNPYSFAIAGVNDPSVTQSASASSNPLAGASASLTGYYRTV